MNKLYKLAAIALSVGIMLSPAAVFAQNNSKGSDALKSGTAVEVAITEPGTVLVRGAKVTAISGVVVTAQTTWGATSMTWTVTTDSNTKFYSKQGNTATLAQVAVGDTVSFAGPFNGSPAAVKADAFKDWTLENNVQSLSGSVSSVNAGSNSLVLTRGNSTSTVQLGSGATITNKSGTSIALSALVAGDSIKARGTWDTGNTIFTATSIVATQKVTADQKRYESLLKRWFSGHFNFNFR